MRIITSTSFTWTTRSTMSSFLPLIQYKLETKLLTISISTSSKCLICFDTHPFQHSPTFFIVLTLLHGDVFQSTRYNSNPQLTLDHGLVSILFMIHLQQMSWMSYCLHRCLCNQQLSQFLLGGYFITKHHVLELFHTLSFQHPLI